MSTSIIRDDGIRVYPVIDMKNLLKKISAHKKRREWTQAPFQSKAMELKQSPFLEGKSISVALFTVILQMQLKKWSLQRA